MNTDNALAKSNFVSRLKSLQSLCSETDVNYPKALLFVPGQDGRFNKGSITLVKYLFRGCVAKELFDETLESYLEPLEDLIILIKSDSLSLILSHEMKQLLSPIYGFIPGLVEYLSSHEEENEIDSSQARKCCDFKRMMLESVRDGEGVGIPIPIGYDDIQDIESWPILQSFALDQVYCPTGFFTARYNVADVTEHLEILFRTVDGYYADNAVVAMHKTVRPHMLQSIAMLDAATADQRGKVSAEDVVGPLEMLYEFGELDVPGALDPATRPVVLFGSDTAHFAVTNNNGVYGNKWQQAVVGNSLHAVIEGCEPSTGLRWCRTYFLQRGKAVDLISDADALVADEDDEEEPMRHTASVDTRHHTNPSIGKDTISALSRLEALYVKLWLSLRTAVHSAFAAHTDVLEAGTFIQQQLDNGLTKSDVRHQESKESVDGQVLPGVVLGAGERLQVHVDCMNALGEIAAIEDVDDMGGNCWVYIRVSVHGISLGGGLADVGTVAVGDTFLFSSHCTVSRVDLTHSLDRTASSGVQLPLVSDGFCITHTLPYYRCFLGGGLEEKAAHRVIACSRSPHKLALLGLGQQLDYTGSGTLSLPVLTDHLVVPVVEHADIRIFSEGFLIEKLDVNCAPVLVSISKHVERVWVVDSAECIEQAFALLPKVSSRLPQPDLPSGLLVVFRLHNLEEEDLNRESDLFRYNPLQRSMPFIASDGLNNGSSARHIAIFVRTGCRAAAAMTTACAAWRVACRVHDVQEHRGADMALPAGILRSFLTAIDVWGFSGASSDDKHDELLYVPTDVSDVTLAVAGSCLTQNPRVAALGLGFQPLRLMHALSEAKRLSPFDHASLLYSEELTPADVAAAKKAIGKRELLVVVGYTGSAVGAVGAQLASQLKERLPALATLSLDFSQIGASATERCGTDQVLRFVSNVVHKSSSGSAPVTMVMVTLSAAVQMEFSVLLAHLAVSLSARIASVCSVVSAASMSLNSSLQFKYAEMPFSASHYGVGQETWMSAVRRTLEPSCCDLALVVDVSSAAAAYSEFRAYMATTNPSALILRLSPSALRLGEEGVDQVLQLMANKEETSSRVAASVLRGYPPAYLEVLRNTHPPAARLVTSAAYIPKIVGAGLRAVKVAPPSADTQWNVGNLLKTLQVLFPDAMLYSAAVQDTWNVPPKSSSIGSFSRLRELARAKVLATRQCVESSKRYKESAKRFLHQHTAQVANLTRSVRGVHGVVHLKAGIVLSSGKSEESQSAVRSAESSWASIDACKGFIVLRILNDTQAGDCSEMAVEGVLSREDEVLLGELFGMCEQVKLPRKELLRASELSVEDRLSIQTKPKYADSVPLPGNVWFDGHSYVDINGSRNLLRPDIDVLVEAFMKDENRRRQEYNEQLVDF